jgi:hypothetical protein
MVECTPRVALLLVLGVPVFLLIYTVAAALWLALTLTGLRFAYRWLCPDDEPVVGARAPFGRVIGVGPKGVPAHSCHYASIVHACLLGEFVCLPFTIRHTSDEGGRQYGVRWQCVEYARRWLMTAAGHTFDDCPTAAHMFGMRDAVRLSDGARVAWDCVPNGSGPERARPTAGCLLIWHARGHFVGTGHVAVVTVATDTYVRVAEQNFDDRYWPAGREWARELPVTVDAATGAYTIGERVDGEVCGWMQLADASAAVLAAPSAFAANQVVASV